MNYCPRCATPLVQREHAGRVRPVCPACHFVHYVNPLPVAACLAESAGGLYLIRRRQAPRQGDWALPAGFIEHGEAPAAAAARETLEETGLTVAVIGLVGVYPYTEQGGAQSGIVIAYQARVVAGQPVAGDDAEAVCLFDPADLPADLAFQTHRAAIDDWLTLAGLGQPAG